MASGVWSELFCCRIWWTWQECFPYIARRLITDDSFRMREALRHGHALQGSGCFPETGTKSCSSVCSAGPQKPGVGRSYLYKGRSRIAVSRIDELATGFGNFTNLMRLVCTSRREIWVVSGSWVKFEG